MKDYLLLALGIFLVILGIIGCVLPVIPGPPISFAAMLVLHFSRFGEFSLTILVIFGALALIVTVLDYIVPVWGTKKFGGTKAGMWGSTIGLIFGLFFLPFIGIIIGPFVGAVIGETIAGQKFGPALKAGFGSFLGFLLGVGMKLAVSFAVAIYFVKEVLHNLDQFKFK
ncbi:MAG: DUF456 domain-containing protein [Bacteroidales bacterium]|nr:DUF456 domain-containing protein [Bacteroidales bacterium]